jgi:hypothetical protein
MKFVISLINDMMVGLGVMVAITMAIIHFDPTSFGESQWTFNFVILAAIFVTVILRGAEKVMTEFRWK